VRCGEDACASAVIFCEDGEGEHGGDYMRDSIFVIQESKFRNREWENLFWPRTASQTSRFKTLFLPNYPSFDICKEQYSINLSP
jgi:hypothetical protein